MAKKRSCRRNEVELEQHERAVKIRKMTDGQICTYIKKMCDKAFDKGYAAAAQEKPPEPVKEYKGVSDFIDYLAKNKIKGIGGATISKIMHVASENGYIQ